MTRLWPVGSAVPFGVLLLLVAASAQAQSVDARLADLRLAAAVRLALVQNGATRGLDVDVTAQDGAVRLAGADAVNAEARRVARGVAGVRSVDGRVAAPGTAAASRPAADPARPEPPRADVPRAEPPRAETPRAAPPRPEPTGPSAHTVAWGDTLSSLARRYDTTVEVLRRLNGLGPTDGIELGRRLRVR